MSIQMDKRCKWCGKILGVLKGIFICGACDYDHAHATGIPNEHLIRDQNPRP